MLSKGGVACCRSLAIPTENPDPDFGKPIIRSPPNDRDQPCGTSRTEAYQNKKANLAVGLEFIWPAKHLSNRSVIVVMTVVMLQLRRLLLAVDGDHQIGHHPISDP